MPINSRTKGKVGELEFVHYLGDHGLDAYRGQQFRGGAGSPDVVCLSLPDVHFEVKRVEAGNPYKWLEQAIADGGPANLNIVAHRKNKREWLAILPMEDLLRLLILREKHYDDALSEIQPQPQGNSTSLQVQAEPKGKRKRAPRQRKAKNT